MNRRSFIKCRLIVNNEVYDAIVITTAPTKNNFTMFPISCVVLVDNNCQQSSPAIQEEPMDWEYYDQNGPPPAKKSRMYN